MSVNSEEFWKLKLALTRAASKLDFQQFCKVVGIPPIEQSKPLFYALGVITRELSQFKLAQLQALVDWSEKQK